MLRVPIVAISTKRENPGPVTNGRSYRMNKKYTLYLLINTRTNQVKVNKRPPRNMGGYWVPIKLNLNLNVPNNEYEINANVELSEGKVTEMVVEELIKD